MRKALAPKERNVAAQGDALGSGATLQSLEALKGRDKFAMSIVSPRWGCALVNEATIRDPGLRFAPTWALESRPFGAQENCSLSLSLSRCENDGMVTWLTRGSI